MCTNVRNHEFTRNSPSPGMLPNCMSLLLLRRSGLCFDLYSCSTRPLAQLSGSNHVRGCKLYKLHPCHSPMLHMPPIFPTRQTVDRPGGSGVYVARRIHSSLLEVSGTSRSINAENPRRACGSADLLAFCRHHGVGHQALFL